MPNDKEREDNPSTKEAELSDDQLENVAGGIRVNTGGNKENTIFPNHPEPGRGKKKKFNEEPKH